MLLAGAAVAAAAEPPKPYVAEDGQFPWADCINIYSIEGLPVSLSGTDALPLQNCGSRMLRIPGQPKSITAGVQPRDVDALRGGYPGVQVTPWTFLIQPTAGTGIPYDVFTLADPPATMTGPFLGGLVLLKIEPAEPGTVRKAPVQTDPSKRMPLAFKPGEKGKLHIYVLMGQSNMVGRDTTGLASQTADPRIGFYGGENRWFLAIEPMFGGSGFGPGISFAKAMLAGDPEGEIGLVPCAVGGTPLSRWVKGADLYEKALKRTKEAMAYGTLEGMLWHQGESDSNKPEDANAYEARLVQMFRDFRQDVGDPNLPIVAGQLGTFVAEPQIKVVMAGIRHLPSDLPLVGYADSAGLGHKGDHLHFNAESQQEFGRRYAEAMLGLKNVSDRR